MPSFSLHSFPQLLHNRRAVSQSPIFEGVAVRRKTSPRVTRSTTDRVKSPINRLCGARTSGFRFPFRTRSPPAELATQGTVNVSGLLVDSQTVRTHRVADGGKRSIEVTLWIATQLLANAPRSVRGRFGQTGRGAEIVEAVEVRYFPEWTRRSTLE
ncbi:hypothetical protein N7532_011298 [Penicillium argentinense]|uniref:Uncharacterized protein n=1 Tax=Penicillium argentinense TaxID=1131581 RepID=A0A9W9EIC8_9EURO|nr:uncharacterized protein N7532_011298 [Penicillium argentinense]KAJ5082255.1 hypothetical protein N7532_011298 [Penicillium argentinense]